MQNPIICPFCGTENESSQAACHNCQTNFRQADLFRTLSQRLARLETIVAQLQRERTGRPPDPPPQPDPLLEIPAARPGPPRPVTLPPVELPPLPKPAANISTKTEPPTTPPPTNPLHSYLPDNIWRTDFWFNKIGLGLLLLALAFLFNYAIDQGWIGPPERIATGLILGTALLGIGYRTAQKRPNFGQTVQGGGLAAYYITGFAAFRLYDLVSFAVAFGFMLLVTVLAFTLSLRQKQAMLSLIGGLGGLATPFLLNTGQGNYIGLILYTCLICGSLVLIYYFQGWQSLLWLANVGGWGIMLGVLWTANLLYSRELNAENITLQGGALFGLLMFWGVPVLRKLDWLENPTRLPAIQFGIFDTYLARINQHINQDHPRLTILFNPLIALFLTWQLWFLTDLSKGLITLATAVLFALIAWGISIKPGRRTLWVMHGVTAVLLLNIALLQLFDGSWLLLALAVEAAVLHFSTRIQQTALELWAHLLSLIVTVALFTNFAQSIIYTNRRIPILNQDALVGLTIIGLWYAVAYYQQTKTKSALQPAYWLTAHITLLFWLNHELQLFNTPGLVAMSWGIHALFFHWDARRQEMDMMRWIPHLLSMVIIGLLWQQMVWPERTTAVLNLLPLFNLALIALIFVTSFLFTEQDEKYLHLGYRLVAHITLLGWFWQELSPLGGQGVVTLVWGIYALILLGISLTYHYQLLRLVAIGTLFALVGKLFLVDLATVETVWRILLFAGFGGLFLVISYFYRSWLHLPEHAD